MSLWVGISNSSDKSLGVEEADTIEQAYYQFMQRSIYPERCIKLPDIVVTRDEMEGRIDAAYADNSIICGGYRDG